MKILNWNQEDKKMELYCNLKLIEKYELNPNLYFYLLYLYLEEKFPWELLESELRYLERKSWIKITEEKVVLRSLFYTTFKTYLETLKTDSWIEEWRNLWPVGVKTMGRPVRGDKQGCLNKMRDFVKNHPNYTKEQIFDATRLYIFDRQLDNYNAMTCADYFIYKESKKGGKVSLLAANLEDLGSKDSILKQMEKGNSTFQKNI